MSRSGYCDDITAWSWIKWRGQVTAAMRGARGQQLLKELRDGLDAMPVKELIKDQLQADGKYCALGVVGCVRGIDMSNIDPEDFETVTETFNIANALAREITYVNDEDGYWNSTPAQRWQRVRDWVEEQLEYINKMENKKKLDEEKTT